MRKSKATITAAVILEKRQPAFARVTAAVESPN
jgi:hypothetical protein